MDKSKTAVALKYNIDTDETPKLTAKGKGIVAEKIIAIAKEKNIPLYEDSQLSQVLQSLDIDTEIPPELYHAVAEALVFIYKLNKQF